MFRNLIIPVFIIGALAFQPAFAQVDNNDTRRIELAKKMHEVKPLSNEIDSVLQNVALNFPEDRRDEFLRRMNQIFEIETLTEISVNAMAETFTVEELEAMIAYFSSEEGKSIEQKMPVYQALLQPEVTRLVDKAIMQLRTGASPE